jgi:hypothetical protein
VALAIDEGEQDLEDERLERQQPLDIVAGRHRHTSAAMIVSG